MIEEYTLYVHTEEKKCEAFKRLMGGGYEKITVEDIKKVLAVKSNPNNMFFLRLFGFCYFNDLINVISFNLDFSFLGKENIPFHFKQKKYITIPSYLC